MVAAMREAGPGASKAGPSEGGVASEAGAGGDNGAFNAGEELDCLTCSACCRGHAGVIPVTAADLVRFRHVGRPDLAARIAPGHFGDEAMETRADGACVHLGRPGLPHHCSIYDVRPSVCGDFERGSAQCLEARRYAARP